MGFVLGFMPVSYFLKGFPFWLSKFGTCASEGENDTLGGSSLSKVFLWLSVRMFKRLYFLAYGFGFVEGGGVWFFAGKERDVLVVRFLFLVSVRF